MESLKLLLLLLPLALKVGAVWLGSVSADMVVEVKVVRSTECSVRSTEYWDWDWYQSAVEVVEVVEAWVG
jgi:hypothetical protein